jgi:prepilin signal peptidase PulO-like enzyme (type II secretory pathway)
MLDFLHWSVFSSLFFLVLFGSQCFLVLKWLPVMQTEFQTELPFIWTWDRKAQSSFRLCLLGFLCVPLILFVFEFLSHRQAHLSPVWVLMPVIAALCYFDSVSLFLPDALNALAASVTLCIFVTKNSALLSIQGVGLNLILLLFLFLIMKLYSQIREKDGMGFGDIKLLLWMSFWLSAYSLVWMFIAASVLALMARGFERWIWMKKKSPNEEAFAFGPWLLMAFVWLVLIEN